MPLEYVHGLGRDDIPLCLVVLPRLVEVARLPHQLHSTLLIAGVEQRGGRTRGRALTRLGTATLLKVEEEEEEEEEVVDEIYIRIYYTSIRTGTILN